MEDIILTCFGVGIVLIAIFKVLILISEHLEVKNNYYKLNEYKKELEKEVKELKTINKILEEDKKDKVHISHCEEQTRFLKIRILELKGYNRRCDDSKGYIFYEHGEEFKVVALWNYAEEVYELDQNGEIFPTRELAERSLLASIEKEEQAKEELKKKYNEDIEEEPEEEIDFASMSQDQMRMFLEERYGYCNGLGGIQIIKGSEFLKIKKETK